MKKLANILFISAMLIFGTIGIIVKFIPLDASEIAFYRSILALLVITLYFIIKKITSLCHKLGGLIFLCVKI